MAVTTTTNSPISTPSLRSTPGAHSSFGLPSFLDHADSNRDQPRCRGPSQPVTEG